MAESKENVRREHREDELRAISTDVGEQLKHINSDTDPALWALAHDLSKALSIQLSEKGTMDRRMSEFRKTEAKVEAHELVLFGGPNEIGISHTIKEILRQSKDNKRAIQKAQWIFWGAIMVEVVRLLSTHIKL